MPKKKKTLQQLETIYTHGSDSYRKLSEKYGVPEKRISYYAKRNNWVEKRRQFRGKVRAKADAKEANRQADRLVGIDKAADKIVEIINDTLLDDKQFRRRTYIDKAGLHEEEVQTVNVSALKELAGALKTLSDLIRTGEKENVEITIQAPEGMNIFES